MDGININRGISSRWKHNHQYKNELDEEYGMFINNNINIKHYLPRSKSLSPVKLPRMNVSPTRRTKIRTSPTRKMMQQHNISPSKKMIQRKRRRKAMQNERVEWSMDTSNITNDIAKESRRHRYAKRKLKTSPQLKRSSKKRINHVD